MTYPSSEILATEYSALDISGAISMSLIGILVLDSVFPCSTVSTACLANTAAPFLEHPIRTLTALSPIESCGFLSCKCDSDPESMTGHVCLSPVSSCSEAPENWLSQPPSSTVVTFT